MLSNRWKDKETMIYIHQWGLFTHEEEQNYVISRKTNEDENHNIGQNKLDLDKRQMSRRITFISLEQSNQQKPGERFTGAQGIREPLPVMTCQSGSVCADGRIQQSLYTKWQTGNRARPKQGASIACRSPPLVFYCYSLESPLQNSITTRETGTNVHSMSL